MSSFPLSRFGFFFSFLFFFAESRSFGWGGILFFFFYFDEFPGRIDSFLFAQAFFFFLSFFCDRFRKGFFFTKMGLFFFGIRTLCLLSPLPFEFFSPLLLCLFLPLRRFSAELSFPVQEVFKFFFFAAQKSFSSLETF